jgi:O-antigen/teichoic acid export membrane protein
MGNRLIDRALDSQAVQHVRGSGLRARVIRGIGGTFVLRAGNAGIQFATGLLLARALGVDRFGVFNYAATWITLLIVPAIFGMDRLLIRELSVHRARAAWGTMRGLLRYATRASLVFAILLAAAVALLGWITYQLTGRPALLKAEQVGLAKPALYTLWIALIVLPLWSVLLVQSAAMQGLRHVVVGQVPEQIVGPGLFLVLVIAAYAFGVFESAQWMTAFEAVGIALALIYSRSLLNRKVPPSARNADPVMEPRVWIAGAIPLTMNRALVTVNSQVDVLMLGAMAGTSAVGVFTAALRGMQLITLVLLSVNTALAPNLAQLHAEGDKERLERTVTQSALLMLVMALPVALFFLVSGHWFLGLFGRGFRVGYAALLALTAGQVINLATGSVGTLLIMTNHERAAMSSAAAGVIVHVALGVLLIPNWNAEGAAVARSFGVVFSNLLMVGVAWRRLGIQTTALGGIMYWLGVARRRFRRA